LWCDHGCRPAVEGRHRFAARPMAEQREGASDSGAGHFVRVLIAEQGDLDGQKLGSLSWIWPVVVHSTAVLVYIFEKFK
jgi:hypothetical protein